MKKLLALLLAVCVVMGCARTIAEDVPKYGVKTKTWTETFRRTGVQHNEELDFSQSMHSITYSENGLAMTYQTLSKNRTKTHIYTYRDGQVVESEKLDPEVEQIFESLIGPSDPQGEYSLDYTFDERGNPNHLRIVFEGKTVREYGFVNQYEGEKLISVTTDQPIDDSDPYPMREFVVHFVGYEDATLTFGRFRYHVRGGEIVSEETVMPDWDDEYRTESVSEYKEGRLVRTARNMRNGDNEASIGCEYDESGKITTMYMMTGSNATEIPIVYWDGVDEQGRECLDGYEAPEEDLREDVPECLQWEQIILQLVRCWMHENGRVAEMQTIMLFSDMTYTYEKFDENGMLIYQEIWVKETDKDGNATARIRTIQEIHYEYR